MRRAMPLPYIGEREEDLISYTDVTCRHYNVGYTECYSLANKHASERGLTTALRSAVH
jgi:hypothetical protein